jgi:hypothetical protein
VKTNYSVKQCPSAVLSTTNPTPPDLDSNLEFRGRKLVTSLSIDRAKAVLDEKIITLF